MEKNIGEEFKKWLKKNNKEDNSKNMYEFLEERNKPKYEYPKKTVREFLGDDVDKKVNSLVMYAFDDYVVEEDAGNGQTMAMCKITRNVQEMDEFQRASVVIDIINSVLPDDSAFDTPKSKEEAMVFFSFLAASRDIYYSEDIKKFIEKTLSKD